MGLAWGVKHRRDSNSASLVMTVRMFPENIISGRNTLPEMRVAPHPVVWEPRQKKSSKGENLNCTPDFFGGEWTCHMPLEPQGVMACCITTGPGHRQVTVLILFLVAVIFFFKWQKQELIWPKVLGSSHQCGMVKVGRAWGVQLEHITVQGRGQWTNVFLPALSSSPSFKSPQGPAHATMLPTFKMALPTSINPVKKICHRPAHRPT